MNLDNLKQVWDEEKIDQTPEISIEKQKEIHTPLDMIRMNMRTEFWMNIIFFPVFLLLPFLAREQEEKFYLAIAIIVLIIGISAYYNLKFYSFYKKISSQNLNTYHSLLDLRYELVLNTELYKSYYIAFIPIIFSFYTILDISDKGLNPTLTIIQTAIFSVILYVTGKYYLHKRYGKYVGKISQTISEITGETDDFEYNRSILNTENSFPFIGKIHSFFEKKFGNKASLAMLIFSIVIILFLACIAGFIVGYFGLIEL